ncbi:adhesion G-protein coupled receptor G4 isoform X3 [Nothobranchius furzeri]
MCCLVAEGKWEIHLLRIISLFLTVAAPPTVHCSFLGDTKAVINVCYDHWTLQSPIVSVPRLMTVCVDVRVVVPGSWVAFSYNSVYGIYPDLGLEGDSDMIYGWLLQVRHQFPIQMLPTIWHRVCLRRDEARNVFSLEVDGKMVAERTVIAQAIPAYGSLWLGCNPRNGLGGNVELYLFRMWADLGDHEFCEDGTVVGWNSQSWAVTSSKSRETQPHLHCGPDYSNSTDIMASTPSSNTSPANPLSTSSRVHPMTSVPVKQNLQEGLLSSGSPLVNCNISQLCSNQSAYFWMLINVNASESSKTEQELNSLVSKVFACNDAASFSSFCQAGGQLQVVEVTCRGNKAVNRSRSSCSVLLFLSRAVSVCDLRRAAESALQRAGGAVQATILGNVERVGRDLCENVSPSGGTFVKCSSTSLDDICLSNTTSNVTCSLLESNSELLPQERTDSCSPAASSNFCSCDAFCETTRQFYALRIDLMNKILTTDDLRSLLLQPAIAVICGTTEPCISILTKYKGAHLECHGTNERLYSCMVILEMSGPVDGCTLNKLVQKIIKMKTDISSGGPLSHMMVCGPPGLSVDALLASNVTWADSNLSSSDVCHPHPTLIECKNNETLAVLLANSCPPEPRTTTIQLPTSVTAAESTLSSVTYTTEDIQPNHRHTTTHNSTWHETEQRGLQTSSNSLTGTASDKTGLTGITSTPPDNNLAVQNGITATNNPTTPNNGIVGNGSGTSTLSSRHKTTHDTKTSVALLFSNPSSVFNVTTVTSSPHQPTDYSAFTMATNHHTTLSETTSSTIQPTTISETTTSITYPVISKTTTSNSHQTTISETTTSNIHTQTHNLTVSNSYTPPSETTPINEIKQNATRPGNFTTLTRQETTPGIIPATHNSTRPIINTNDNKIVTTPSSANAIEHNTIPSSIHPTINKTTLSTFHRHTYDTRPTPTPNPSHMLDILTTSSRTDVTKHNTTPTNINTNDNITVNLTETTMDNMASSNTKAMAHHTTTLSNISSPPSETTSSAIHTHSHNSKPVSFTTPTQNKTRPSIIHTTDNATTPNIITTNDNTTVHLSLTLDTKTSSNTIETTPRNSVSAKDNGTTTTSIIYTSILNATTPSSFIATTPIKTYTTEHSFTNAIKNYTTMPNKTHLTDYTFTTPRDNRTKTYNANTPSSITTTEYNSRTHSMNYTATTAGTNDITATSNHYLTAKNTTTSSKNSTTVFNTTLSNFAATHNETITFHLPVDTATPPTKDYTATTPSEMYSVTQNSMSTSNSNTTSFSPTVAKNFTATNNAATSSFNHTSVMLSATTSSNNHTTYNATPPSRNYTTANYDIANNYTAMYITRTPTSNSRTAYNVTLDSIHTTLAATNPSYNYTSVVPTSYNASETTTNDAAIHRGTTPSRNQTAMNTATTPRNPHTSNNASVTSINYVAIYNATTQSNNHPAVNTATTPSNILASYNASVTSNSYETIHNSTKSRNNETAMNTATTPRNPHTSNNASVTSINYVAIYNATTQSNNHPAVNTATTPSNILASYNASVTSNSYETIHNSTKSRNNETAMNTATTPRNPHTSNNASVTSINYVAIYNATTQSNNHPAVNTATTPRNPHTHYNASVTSIDYAATHNATTFSNSQTSGYHATMPSNDHTVPVGLSNYTATNGVVTSSNNYTTLVTRSPTTASRNMTTAFNTSTEPTREPPLNTVVTSNATNSTVETIISNSTQASQINTSSVIETSYIKTTKGPIISSTTDNAIPDFGTIAATTTHDAANKNLSTTTTSKISTTKAFQSTGLTTSTSTLASTGTTSATLFQTTASQQNEEKANQLWNETQNASQLNASQMSQLVDEMENLLDDSTVSESVGQMIINIVSKLMDSNSSALSGSANRLIRLVEKLGFKLHVGGDSKVLNSTSLVLAVRTVDGTNFQQTSMHIYNTHNVQLNGPDGSRLLLDLRSKGQPLGSVNLPSSLTNGLSPQEKKRACRVHFTFYTKNTLFQDASLDNQTFVSPVLGSSVANLSISHLSEKIEFTITNMKPIHATNMSCVFWDFKLNGGGGGWSSDGCSVVNFTSDHTTCNCDHLTSFAILLDLSRQGLTDPKQAQILTFITYIGCGISSIFLAVTIATHLLFRKLMRDIPSKILVQLCLALLLLNLVFLLDSWLSMYKAVGLCISTAFFLHYFLLSSFTWVGLEALHMYLSIVQVFTPYLSSYMLKFSLMGWGIPLIVVIIVIAVDKDNYGLVTYGKYTDGSTDDFCWLRNNISFYVGVVTYFLLIFILCLIVFITVMVQLNRIKKQNPHNQSPNRGAMTDLRSILGLVILLGLTWGFALFAWGDLYLPFVYLFSIFNSLQGFFVFVFHCAVKESVRRQWRTHLCFGKLRLAENSDWSRTATQNIKNAIASAPHFSACSLSPDHSRTNSRGSGFWDSGIFDRSNNNISFNGSHRQHLSR